MSLKLRAGFCLAKYQPVSVVSMIAAVSIGLSLSSCDGSSEIVGTTNPLSPPMFSAAQDGTLTSALTFDLSGAQVLPPSDTRATGRASFVLNEETLQLYGVLDTSISDVLSVNIREGASGEVGAAVASLYQLGNGQFTLPVSTYLTIAQKEMYDNGHLYIDVVGDGVRIRGQLSATSEQPLVAATLSDIQAKIFTPMCSGCHAGSGVTLPGVMDLTNAQASFISLVGVNSLSVDDLLRVEPGSPDESFLLHKIQGTQTVGSRMPFRGAQLDEQSINSIRQWIALGALR